MKKVSHAVQAVDGAVKAINNSRSRLQAYRIQLNAVRGQLIRVIKDVCPEPIGELWGNDFGMDCVVDGTFCEPTINIYMHNLDSFKDSRLLNVLEYFEDLGNAKTDTRDYAQSVNRSYRFKYDNFMVRVDATVRSDSPTCRRVVVGTEIAKIEKYEIQCD